MTRKLTRLEALSIAVEALQYKTENLSKELDSYRRAYDNLIRENEEQRIQLARFKKEEG